MAEIKLGQNNRTINTNTLKGGIKREDLKTEVQKKIFDALNANTKGQTDNVLDAEEINNIMNYLIELSGDDLKLGKRDAKKFFKELNLENLSQEDLFDFIEQLSKSQGDIVQSSVQELDGQRVILTVRENDQQNEDGSHQLTTTEEQINTDGTSQINVTTTTDFNTDDKMTTSKSVMHSGETITRSYLNDAGEIVLDSDGNEVLQKETTVSGDTTTVTEFDSKGNKFYETVTYGKNSMIQEEYEYVNVNGEQKRQLAVKTEGDNTTYYIYDNKGNLIRTNSTNGVETTYEYNDAGTLRQETTLEGDKLTRLVYQKNGGYIKHDCTGVEAVRDEDGNVVSYNFNKKVSTTYDENNHALRQEIDSDKQYTITYDGAGNTEGIVVQFGETPENIAAKFGCDVNKIIELNGGRQAFGTGATIKIPGELQADTEALQGRGTSAEELQKQQNHQARVARQQAAQAECDARVVVSYKVEDEVVYVKGKGFQSIYDYDLKTANGIVNYLYHQEGQHETTATSFNARLAQLKKENPGRFDSKGKLINPDQPLKLPVNEALAQKWNAEVVRNTNLNVHAEEYFANKQGSWLASKARNKAICHTEAGGLIAGTDLKALNEVVDALDSSNIVGFLTSYENLYGESFTKAMRGENAINGKPIEDTVLTKIRTSLQARADELGLSSITAGFNAINPNNDTETIDRIINGIIRDIKSVELNKATDRTEFVANLNNVSSDSATQYLALGENSVDRANQIVDNQDANESAMEWVFDRALNWSSSSMSGTRKKISAFETKLNEIRTACTNPDGTLDEDKFKQMYHTKFGVPFNQKLINQFIDVNEKLNCTLANEAFRDDFVNNNYTNLDEDALRNRLYNSPLFQSQDLKTQIAQMDKEQMCALVQQTGDNLGKLCEGIGTKGQISAQIERIGSQAFGPDNDVVGDANHFVSVQKQGGMFTEVGVMIASMVAGPILGTAGKAASSLRFANTAKLLNAGARTFQTTGYMRTAAAVTTTMPLTTETVSGVMRANAHQGEAVYKTNESGEIVYDREGNPIVDHYKTFGEAFDEGTDYKNATIRTAINATTFGVGAASAKSLYAAYESGLMSGKEAVAKLIGIDVAMGTGAEIVTTGDVSLEGLSMNLVMSALGHAYGLNSARAGHSSQTDNTTYDRTTYSNREGYHEQLRDNQGNVVDIVKDGVNGEPSKMVIRGPEGDEIVIEFNRETPRQPLAETDITEPNVLDVATGNNTQNPGGKLGTVSRNGEPSKMERARTQTEKVAENGTPKRVAEAYDEASKHQTVNRNQGRQLQQITLEKNGIIRIGKEKIDIATADAATLARVKKAVEQYSKDSPLRKQLESRIQSREEALVNNTPVESSRGSEIIENINLRTAENAERILTPKQEGRTETVGPSDARILTDHITNNLNTIEELQNFIVRLKKLVGTYEKGNMYVKEVQGKDYAAEVLKTAEQKIADLTPPETHISNASNNTRGLNGQEQAAIKKFIENSTSVEDLNLLLTQLRQNSIRKSANGLIKTTEAKIKSLGGEPVTNTSAQPAPKPATKPTESTTGKKSDSPAAEPTTKEVVTEPVETTASNVVESVVVQEPVPTSVSRTTEYGNLKPGDKVVGHDSNGNRVEVGMDEYGNLTRTTYNGTDTNTVLKVEMTDSQGVTTEIKVTPDKTTPVETPVETSTPQTVVRNEADGVVAKIKAYNNQLETYKEVINEASTPEKLEACKKHINDNRELLPADKEALLDLIEVREKALNAGTSAEPVKPADKTPTPSKHTGTRKPLPEKSDKFEYMDTFELCTSEGQTVLPKNIIGDDIQLGVCNGGFDHVHGDIPIDVRRFKEYSLKGDGTSDMFYNTKYDCTAIIVHGQDNGIAAIFQLQVPGRISQTDAAGLIKYLQQPGKALSNQFVHPLYHTLLEGYKNAVANSVNDIVTYLNNL